MMLIPPPLIVPLRMVVHKNLILGAFPVLRSGNLVVSVELHRLVFPVWRLVSEIELLNLEVLVDGDVLRPVLAWSLFVDRALLVDVRRFIKRLVNGDVLVVLHRWQGRRFRELLLV